MIPTADRLQQLDEISADLVIAPDFEAVVAALLHLVAWLREDREEAETAILLQLVREAVDLLQNPESQVDLRDWLRTAAPFVRSDR